jgi:hypothetical protein
VRSGDCASSGSCGLAARILIGGGGGGGAADSTSCSVAGGGGGANGSNGSPGNACGGGGGSQAGGGNGGGPRGASGAYGTAGSSGAGGQGGGYFWSGLYYGSGGGGGGGGYFGGGGGGTGGGGGGGSGFGPSGVAFETGSNVGDGRVVITFSPPAVPTPTPIPLPTPTILQVNLPVPAPGTVLRQDLAGQRIATPGDTAIYLVDIDGSKRHIPDPTTYNNLFRDWSGIQAVDASTIWSGPALTSGAYLATAQETLGAVYLIDNGQKRWITSPAAMDKFWFNWNTVRKVPQSTLTPIPNGPDIS